MKAIEAARGLVAAAVAEGRTALLEHEGYALLEAFGVRCAPHVFVPAGQPIADADLAALPGSRVVLKAASPALLHKSDVGGVLVVERDPRAVAAGIADLAARLAGHDLRGTLVAAFVAHDPGFGGELLVAPRWLDEFGPVVTIAAGGISSEFLGARLQPLHAAAALSPHLRPGSVAAACRDVAAVAAAIRPRRGSPPLLDERVLASTLEHVLRLAAAMGELGIRECEMNPVVAHGGQLVALDALVTLGPPGSEAPRRPLARMHALLAPQRIGVIGVSATERNIGRVILDNLLDAGTESDRIVVIKPGVDRVAGCRAVPDLAALDAPLDLLVVAVSAAQVPDIVEAVVAHEAAQAVILIPGGLEEKAGGAEAASRIRSALDHSRATTWGGPLVVGGNCMGVLSRPGRYDTLFIPRDRLPAPSGPGDALAVVSQSGAFAITRIDRWSPLAPRYVLTMGNQVDATIGDALAWLAQDPSIATFAVYVEGFKPGDGLRTLRAAREIAASGRSLVLYRAGRTAAGAQAAASHTASIAGDAPVTSLLFRDAGAMVAESVDAFDDLVQLSLRLHGRSPGSGRLGAISNAGFECVAVADSLGSLSLATLAPDTCAALSTLLDTQGVARLVDVHNPLDVSPMTGDAGYEAIARALAADDGVDVLVLGCVPFTPTLGVAAADLQRPDGLAARLAGLWREESKPMVVVVDAGGRYDPLAAALAAAGLPVFRTMDRAVRAIGSWTAAAARR